MSEGMKTINDLILDLQGIEQVHGNLPVLVSGYEGGYDAPRALTVLTLTDMGEEYKKENWWYGRYDTDRDTDDMEFDAVVIP